MSAPFNPREAEIVPAPTLDFTISEFAAWVDSKPAGEAYDYNDRSACAVCQFLIANGVPDPVVGVGYWKADGVEHWFPEGLSGVLDNAGFGALALRLKGLSE